MAETGTARTSYSAEVAYLLKGYPRISETFIASEVFRLEQLGVPLRLFVLKPPDEPARHPVVDRIRATPDYLPVTTSLSGTTAPRWLARNLRPFLPSLVAVARWRPAGLARAAGRAVAQAVRARRHRFAAPRTIYLKEFLYAVTLADRLRRAPTVRHLHAHFAHGCTTVAWLTATITGLPFSFTGHAKDIYTTDLNPAGLLGRKMRAATFVVTCTRANARHLATVERRTPVHVVHHGLSVDVADQLAGDAGHRSTGAPPLRLLGVGRLVPKKGFDTFVRACAVLHDAGVPFRAEIAGEPGVHGTVVRALVAELGLAQHVRLLGTRSPAELAELYRRADVFSLACRVTETGDRDGIPNVLVEAMACAVPVVSTDVSGIPELVRNGENGLLVRPDDPQALAGAWHRLADDPALARRLGAAGRETVVRGFDGSASATALAALFAPLLDGVPVRAGARHPEPVR